MRPFAFMKSALALGPLVLTAQWRNYAGELWVSDVSPAFNLDHTGFAPFNDAGASLNGHPSADLIAELDGLFRVGFLDDTGADNMSALVNAGSGSIYVLFSADTAVSDPGGDHQATSAIVSQSSVLGPNATIRITYSTSGVHAIIYDGLTWTGSEYTGGTYHYVTVPASVGDPHLAQVRWGGGSLQLRVDDGEWASTSAGNIEPLVGPLTVGWDTWSWTDIGAFDGQVWEVGTSQEAGTDEQFDAILDGVRDYYDIAL